MTSSPLSKDSLQLDCANAVDAITRSIRQVLTAFRRRGLVVALSGGIDSSVTAALCVMAVGPERVFGIHMPDKESAAETLKLSQSVSSAFGFTSVIEEITPLLEAARCYDRQKEAIRLIIPEYGNGWRSKIVLENILDHKGYNHFHIVAQAPDGRVLKERMTAEAYLGVVAATNFKQRVRKMLEYYHGDRLNYAVTGTPNRLEYDQGFFVKLGDGAGDIKPIAHLYKSQVYQLASYLGVPEEIMVRPPTTDTYSLPQGQDEFYFALPYGKMDLCLYAKNAGNTAEEVAPLVGLTVEQVGRVFGDIEAKRAATRYLHAQPKLVEKILEIGTI